MIPLNCLPTLRAPCRFIDTASAHENDQNYANMKLLRPSLWQRNFGHACWATRDSTELARVSELTEDDRLSDMLGVGDASAFNNLVGFLLANIFAAHFKSKAGYTKDKDTGAIKNAPFVNFVKEVFVEFEIKPNDRKAIADALTKWRSKSNRQN
jgi:hypothetical protein